MTKTQGLTGTGEYHRYITSEKWREKSRQAKILANYKCERCGEKKHLHVHHHTYERFGHELDVDLEVICRAHHCLEHGGPSEWRRFGFDSQEQAEMNIMRVQRLETYYTPPFRCLQNRWWRQQNLTDRDQP